MRREALAVSANLFLAAALCAPAWADTGNAGSAVPGTLNYVEGKASLGNQALNSKSIGSAELEAGQSLRTEAGKVEILLTPGVFLRLGSESSVRMISAGLTNTEVELDRGHAMVEVAEIHPENDLRIVADGTTTTLLKTGLYDFNLREKEIRVFDGKAIVQDATEHAKLKGGREVSVGSDVPLKAKKFDKKAYEDGDLYRWSSLRSAYVAEANVNAAGIYNAYGWGPWGPGWWGAGWYWDPWFDGYTFIPADGIFFSPFGWGFYSPWFVTAAPIYGVGFGYGYRPYLHHFSTNYHNWGAGTHYVATNSYAHGIYNGAGSRGGFHSGMVSGGGFRGAQGGAVRGGGFSGGGFHGGGFSGGGGFHGGGGGHGR